MIPCGYQGNVMLNDAPPKFINPPVEERFVGADKSVAHPTLSRCSHETLNYFGFMI
jgi:hypothetical protein